MYAFAGYRGMGTGTKFLEIAEKKAKELKLPRLSLIVFEDNEEVKSLYEGHGFYEIAREPAVPHELIRHRGYALPMVRMLHNLSPTRPESFPGCIEH